MEWLRDIEGDVFPLRPHIQQQHFFGMGSGGVTTARVPRSQWLMEKLLHAIAGWIVLLWMGLCHRAISDKATGTRRRESLSIYAAMPRFLGGAVGIREML